MTYSIVYLSDVQKAKRFDAEYFKPEYLEIEEKLERIETDFLFNLASNEYQNFIPATKHEYFEYIEISKVNLITGEYEKEKISNNEQPSRAKKICHQFDLLISTVRPNRNAISLILEDKKDLIASTGFCKLSCQRVNPYFLFILFKINIYVKLLDRKTTATQYPAVNENDILTLKIPLLSQTFQGEIERMVKQAHEAQSQSRQLYKYAETMLLEELGLVGYAPQHRLSFETTKRAVDKAKRFDAEYFQPKYDEINKRIFKNGYILLQDICSAINYGTVPTSPYTNDNSGVPYIKGLNLKNIEINKTKLDKIKNTEDLPEKFYTQKGDIIISQMGTVGDVGVITENEEGWLFASFTIRARLKNTIEFNPLYVGLYIQNIAKKYYLLRNIAQASVRQNTDLPTIKNMPIPLICASVQEDIAHAIEKSHRLRRESLSLLKTATQAVELAIEHGEDTALAFMQAHSRK